MFRIVVWIPTINFNRGVAIYEYVWQIEVQIVNHLITINIFTLRIRRPGTNTVDSRRSFDSRSNHLLKILWQRLFVSLITTILDNTFILYPSFPVLSSIVSPMLSNLSFSLSLSPFLSSSVIFRLRPLSLLFRRGAVGWVGVLRER